MKLPHTSARVRAVIFAASALFICTGAEGGCGGTLEPTIERPTQEASCPETTPDPWTRPVDQLLLE